MENVKMIPVFCTITEYVDKNNFRSIALICYNDEEKIFPLCSQVVKPYNIACKFYIPIQRQVLETFCKIIKENYHDKDSLVELKNIWEEPIFRLLMKKHIEENNIIIYEKYNTINDEVIKKQLFTKARINSDNVYKKFLDEVKQWK